MSQSRSQKRTRYTPTTAHGPRIGALGALLLHGLIATGAMFTWQHRLEVNDESPSIVPVELITIAAKTNIAPTVTRLPDVKSPETPQQIEAPVSKPAPQPPEAELAPDQSSSQPMIVKPQPTPTPMKKPQDVPIAPEPKKSKSDDFSALLNKLTAPAASPRNAKVAQRTVRGIGDMNAMTMELRDALKNQIAQCWSPPVGAPHPERLIPRFQLFLAPDGRVAQPPKLTGESASAAASDPFMRAAADAALRAIYTCQPYKLPADRYSEWRDSEIDFDPRKMFQ